jgi:dTMP kinase
LGLQRKRQAGGEWNRLDDYQVEFYQRVRRAYLDMARLEPERWVIIDASAPFDQVQAEIKSVILQRLAGG